MADAIESIGYVFSAKDMASGVVTKAEENMQAASDAAKTAAEELASSMESVSETVELSMDSLQVEMVSGFEVTEGAIDNLTNNVVAAISVLGDRIEEVMAGATESMSDFDTVVEDTTKSSDALGKKTQSLFGKLTFVKGALTQIAKIGGMGAIMGAGFELGKSGIGKVLGVIGKIVGLVTSVLEPAIEVLGNTIDAALGPLKEVFYELAIQIAPLLSKVLTPVIGIVSKVLGTFVEMIAEGGKGGGILDTVFSTIVDLWNDLKDPLMTVASTLAQLAKTVLPIIARLFGMIVKTAIVPILTKVAEVLSKIVTKLAPIIEKLFKNLEPILGTLVQAFADLAVGLLDAVFPALEPILTMLDEMLPEMLPVLDELIKAFLELAKAILPILPPVLKLVGLVIGKLLGPLVFKGLKLYMKLWTQIYKQLARFVKPIIEKIVDVVEGLVEEWEEFGNIADEVIEAVIGTVKDAWEWIVEKSEWLFNKVVGFFTSIPEKIKSGFTAVLDWIKGKVTGILDFLGLSGIGKRVSGIFDTIKNLIRAPVETIKSVINDTIIETINDVLWWKVPVIGKRLQKILGLSQLSYLAEGGIATEPTPAVVGEGGVAEAIVPLKPEYIQRFVTNVLGPVGGTAERPIEVRTDSELKGLMGKMVNLLEQAVALLGAKEAARAPGLGGL